MGVAALTNTPELELEKEEAQRLAEAVQRVNDYYDNVVPEVVQVWGNLGAACLQIYGPRIIAARNNRKNNRPALIRSGVHGQDSVTQ
jgi:hypothetical protein